ncbi:MAG TPA: hypothetical protein VMV05_03590 [bacterium]|nr:hypothetical protein [bacterium]
MNSWLKRFIVTVGCQLLTVDWVWACPRCVDATPYKLGLQLAVVVLLPVPFACAYWVYRSIRDAEEPSVPAQPASSLTPSLNPVQE